MPSFPIRAFPLNNEVTLQQIREGWGMGLLGCLTHAKHQWGEETLGLPHIFAGAPISQGWQGLVVNPEAVPMKEGCKVQP